MFVCVCATKPKMVHPVIIFFYYCQTSMAYSVIIIILKKPKSSTEIAKSFFSPEHSEGGNNALSKIDENKIYLSIN